MIFTRHILLSCLFCGFVAQTLVAQTLIQSRFTVNVGANPSYIAAADLNDNGWVDLVTADRGTLSDPREERPANDEISILFNKGGEDTEAEVAFIKHQPSLKTGFAPYSIALVNIDALKWPDIVTANFMAVRGKNITLYRNLHQEGIFEAHDFEAPDEGLGYFRHLDGEGSPLFHKPGFSAIAVRDLDGDGLRDAVVTGWASDVLAIFRGNAEKYFEEPVYHSLPGAPRDVLIHDLNGDGILDIAAILYATNEVSLWLGNPEGDWRESTRFPTRGRLPVRLQSADLNGNGRHDLIVTHAHSDDSLVVFYNAEIKPFSLSQELALGEERAVIEHELRDCTVGDFNGDGRMDIAVTCFASAQVKVLLNTEREGNTLPHFEIEDYTFEEGRPRALCAADLNQNGKDDLAVALWDKNAVGFLMSR